MANLKAILRKLQKAILSTGLIIKIGASQFYSREQGRLITVTIISTPVFRPTKRGEWKDCDYEIFKKMNLDERLKLKQSDPDLFTALSK